MDSSLSLLSVFDLCPPHSISTTSLLFILLDIPVLSLLPLQCVCVRLQDRAFVLRYKGFLGDWAISYAWVPLCSMPYQASFVMLGSMVAHKQNQVLFLPHPHTHTHRYSFPPHTYMLTLTYKYRVTISVCVCLLLHLMIFFCDLFM